MGGTKVLKKLAAGAALVMACVAAAPDARADDAEQMFQMGLSAMKTKDYPTACEAFAKSNKADPSPGTQINLALCFEKRKMWASAWGWYRNAVTLAHDRGQKDREQLADESANKLLKQIHYVVVATSPKEPQPLVDLKVTRDGEAVTTMLGGHEVPVPVDPGDHVFEVSAKGKKPWSTTMKFADNNKTDRLEANVLDDVPVEATVPPPPSGTTRVDDYRPPANARDGSGQRVAGIVVGSAGVLCGLASVGVFVLANHVASQRDAYKSDRATIQSDPNWESDPVKKANVDKDSAGDKNKADAADVNRIIAYSLLGGGVVLLGVGTALWATAPKTQRTGITRILPVVSPQHAGLALGGSF